MTVLLNWWTADSNPQCFAKKTWFGRTSQQNKPGVREFIIFQTHATLRLSSDITQYTAMPTTLNISFLSVNLFDLSLFFSMYFRGFFGSFCRRYLRHVQNSRNWLSQLHHTNEVKWQFRSEGCAAWSYLVYYIISSILWRK